MRSASLAILCLSIVLGVGAMAGERPALKVLPETTTKEVLDACGSDDPSMRAETCDDAFQKLMTVAYMQQRAPGQQAIRPLCLADSEPESAFRAKLMAWKRDHPEAQPELFIGDGQLHAFFGAYNCK